MPRISRGTYYLTICYLSLLLTTPPILLGPSPVAGDWLSETRLTTDGMDSYPAHSNQNDIAVDATGNIHVVWVDNGVIDPTGDFEVHYRRHNPTGGWGFKTQLTFKTIVEYRDIDDDGDLDPVYESDDKQCPGIVVDGADNLYVSYENTDDQTVEVIRYDAKLAAWDYTPQVIGDSGTSDSNPALAATGTDIHAVWRKLTGGQHQIYYAPYTETTGWATPQQITSAASDKSTPMIVADASGNLHVVWSDNRDPAGIYKIYYMTKPSGAAWQAESAVSTGAAADAFSPFILADASGDLHLAWEDERDGNFEIYYRHWDASASPPAWGSEMRVTNEAADSRNPHLVVDSSGQVHLLWQDRRLAGGFGFWDFSLYYKKKSPLWGDPVRLSKQGYRGSIAADASGNLHVAYGAYFETFGMATPLNPEVYYLKFDPTITTAPAPSEAVLVLDTSGSMAWKEDGSAATVPSESRLYKAGQALSSFIDRFNLRNPANAHFGLVRFPDAAHTCPSSETVIALTPLTEASRYDAIVNVIPGLVAGGGTPMADGVTRAAGLLSPAVSNKMLLLVSDGYHNCPTTAFPPGFVTGLSDPVYTMGIGTAVEVDFPRLQNLATTTGGEFRDATDTGLMNWLKTIIQTLFGLQAENDPAGVLEARKTVRHESWITRYDTDIAFDISWKTPKAGQIDFQLHTPGGDVITGEKAKTTAGITHISRDTYQIFFLEEPFLGTIDRAGKWLLELSGKHLEPGTKEPYQYSVLLDSSLKMAVELNRKQFHAGDPVAVQVAVREADRVIPADVTMTLYSPQQSLGNFMAKHPVDPQALKEKPGIKNGEPVSDLLRKALVLAEDRQTPFKNTKDRTALRFYDDGTHGDPLAGDLVYTCMLTDTRTPGTYKFEIIANAKTAAGQPFRRMQVLQRRMTVRVTAKDSLLELTSMAGADAYQVALTPRDRLGNHLGPGFADQITFLIEGAVFSSPVRDQLDGSYIQKFTLAKTHGEKNLLIRARVLENEMVFCR